MASYTMQLREYIENATQYEDGLSTRERIEKGRKKLFDFKYPIFDEDYRNVFETNFIRHFYMREIGFETEGLFKFQLESWLNLHMPYFNRLFESEQIEYDPLINSKMDMSHKKTNNRDQTDNRTGSTENLENLQGTTNDNEKVIGTSNDTENRTTDSTIDQTSNTSGTSTGTADSNYSNKEDGTKDTTGSRTEDNFERDLESTTPDSRLTITTQDGQGVIEYASKINEETENNSETTTQKVTDGKTGSGNDHSETSSNTEATSTGNQTGKETESNTKTGEVDTSTTRDGSVESTNTKTGKLTDDYKSKVNDIEDYVQQRTGKIGVQTYSKMIMEYREALLRVERDIFKEMNQLFMLIY